MKKHFILFLLFFYCLKSIYAQPGELDNSFGKKGIVKTDLGSQLNYNTFGKQVFLQTDGSMYLVIETASLTVITKKLKDGSTDITYGNNGFSTSVSISDSRGAMQNDGKIIVAGYTKNSDQYMDIQDFAVARYNADGSLDNTFDGDGIQTTNFDYGDAVNGVAIQNDGKILVAGYTLDYFERDVPFMAIARYRADGSLDTTFDSDGQLKVLGQTANSVAIQSDGKIVVGIGNALDRFNSNGVRDTTFTRGDLFVNPYEGDIPVVIQSDGKFLMSENFQITRFNTDGSLDKIFDVAFEGFGNKATSIAIQGDKKIVLTGYAGDSSHKSFAIARYNTDGSLDNTFSGDGRQLTNFDFSNNYANSAAVQSDGKLVALGYTTNGNNTYTAVARYNNNGSPDISFDEDGKLIDHIKQSSTYYTSTAIQSDGKILAAGYTWNGKNYDFAVARYNINGSLDNTFSGDGTQITDFSSSDDKARAIATQRDGKILIAGSAGDNYGVTRYNTDGSLDDTFDGDGRQTTDFGSSDSATSIDIQSDGKILVAGSALARYNTDGTLDISFDEDGKLTRPFVRRNENYPFNSNDVAIQNDGKIIITGIVHDSENDKCIIARYNNNGSTDSTFGDGVFGTYGAKVISEYDDIMNMEGNSFRGKSIVIQKDGKIVIGGYYERVFRRISSSFLVLRLNSNGSLDNTFNNRGIVFTDPHSNVSLSYGTSVVIQKDNKIILGGYSYNGSSDDFAISRYNTDGSLDDTFSEDGIATTEVGGAYDKIAGIAITGSKLYAVGTGEFLGIRGVVAGYLLGNDENTAPGISITTPPDDTPYVGPATILLVAAASDEDGTIKKVQFYNGTTLLTTEYYFPYTYSWKDVQPGSYSITAKATDDKGAVTTSAPVHVKVLPNYAPIVSVTSPDNNTKFVGPASIPLAADAKDVDGAIEKVEFYNGTALIATEYYLPYTYTWNNVQPGEYAIMAKATDDKGVVATSAAVQISVLPNKAPTVSITYPLNNTSYTGPALIYLFADANDADGTIKKVEFYNGTALIATEYYFPYTYTWNNVPAGNYTITAKATDDKDKETTSAAVHVSVSKNQAPMVNIIAPGNNTKYAAPALIPLVANADDPDGTIKKVEFYDGTTLLATESYFPYTYNWSNVPAGKYKLTAKATDDKGMISTSAVVNVTVEALNNTFVNSDKPSSDGRSSKIFAGSLGLRVNPNPAKNILNIQTTGFEQNNKMTISVISASGVIVKTITATPNQLKETDVSSLRPGVYFLKVSSADKVLHTQFVKL